MDPLTPLGKSPLLAGFLPDEVAAVAAAGKRHSLPGGQAFLRMGGTNASLFIVLTGAVDVERIATGDPVKLATLRPGQSFGEMTFVEPGRVTATVSAVGPTEVLELVSSTFAELFAQDPPLAAKFWRNLTVELKRRLASADELVDHYADLSRVLVDNPSFRELCGNV